MAMHLSLNESCMNSQPAKVSTRPTVSVCIVNWNCSKQLAACLRSLMPRRQRIRLEVIVVDNASTDGAVEMVKSEFPWVRLLCNAENVGFAKGCNQGAKVAFGRYLFFLNNDTIVPAQAIRQMVHYLRKHPTVGLLGPLLRDGNGRVQASVRGLPTVGALLHRLTILRWTGIFRQAYRQYRGRGVPQTTSPAEVLMGAALLMPRRVYREVGGWDEGYTFGGEDIDLCARVRQCHSVVYHPEVEITHLGRVSSRQRPGYVHSNTLVGITRSLRCCGVSRTARLVYKTLFTIDLPFAALVQLMRYGWAKFRRKNRQAQRAWLDLVGLEHFVRRGLGAFWRA